MSKKAGSKSAKNSSDSKTSIQSINYDNITPADIAKVDINDPVLLKQCGIRPFPNYDDLDETERYAAYKSFFSYILLTGGIIEKIRERTFDKLKILNLNNTMEDFGEDYSDQVVKNKKKSRDESDDDKSESEVKPKKGKSSKKSREENSDEEEDSGNESESEDVPKKTKPLTKGKLTKKSKQVDSDEEDNSDEDEEPPKKGKVVKGKVNNKSKNKKDESDEESEESSDEEDEESDEKSDEESEEGSDEKSDEESDEESSEPPKKGKGKNTKPIKKNSKNSKSR